MMDSVSIETFIDSLISYYKINKLYLDKDTILELFKLYFRTENKDIKTAVNLSCKSFTGHTIDSLILFIRKLDHSKIIKKYNMNVNNSSEIDDIQLRYKVQIEAMTKQIEIMNNDIQNLTEEKNELRENYWRLKQSTLKM